MHMLIAFVSWWYGEGWLQQAKKFMLRLDGLLDTFSFSLIIRTLFSPFRQISAGRIDGPIGMQIQAFIDKTISRLIGAMVRLGVMLAGVISIFVMSLIGIFFLLVWPIIPVLPVIGLILSTTGWVPGQ